MQLCQYFFLFSALFCLVSTVPNAPKPVIYSTKPLPNPKVLNQCHPFMLLCIPCEIIVGLTRMGMNRIAFVHKVLENACRSILPGHTICDAALNVTLFYLNHTPPKNICKRLFLCGNSGFSDWWHLKEEAPEGFENSTVWKILTEREQVFDSQEYKNVEKSLSNFSLEVATFDASNHFRNKLTELILTIDRAARVQYLEKNNL